MSEITIPIIWSSNEYIDTPENVTLVFTDQEIEKLKLCLELASKHNVTVSMDISSANDDVLNKTEFVLGYECIRAYSNGTAYYYAQSKYDAGTQIESKAFSLVDIKN